MIELKKLLRIESTDYYPFVYIPKNLKVVLNSIEFYKVDNQTLINKYNLSSPYGFKPTPPEKPVLYKTEYYKVKDEEKYNKNLKTCIISSLIFLLFILLFFSIKNPHNANSGIESIIYLFFAGIIIGLPSLFILISSVETLFSLSKEKNKIQASRYIDKTSEEIEKEEIGYQKYFNLYSEHLNSHNRGIEEFEYRLNKYKDDYVYQKYLQEIKSKITFNRNNDIIKRGKSEDRFLEYLLSAFEPDDLKINISVNTYNSAFYPDFLFVSKDKDFCIDIEIDERYDYKTKKPIHFIGSDDERNNFFLDKNCFIVKFTEEQVTEQPDKCCLFIKEIVNVISKPQSYDLNTYIQQIKPWTFEEAYLQAKSNFRNNS
jgi:hypothetical protein